MSYSDSKRNSSYKKKFSSNGKANPEKKDALTIQLVSRNNVMITGSFFLFNDKLKQTIKACEGRYIPEDKGWVMPRNYIGSILTYIQNEKLDIVINGIPQFVDKLFQPFNGVLNYRTKSGYTKIEYQPSDRLKQVTDLPQDFYQKLYDFQKKGVEFGIKNFGRVLLADEMGVGKTVQALALACIYKNEWPFLVIAPSSLRLIWRDEVSRWIEDLRPSEVQVITKSSVDIKSNIKVLIISYDLASKMSSEIEEFGFQMAIVDEAHYLKNGEAKRTENLVPIIKKCKRCILLTGTPAFARPKELYNLLNIMRPDVFCSFKEFGNRYCDPRPNKWSHGLDYNGAVNTKELHYVLMNSNVIRRLKKDVLSELPPKRRQKIEVKVDAQYVKKIQEAVSKSRGGEGGFSSIVDNFMGAYFRADEASFENEVSRFEDERKREQPEVVQCYLYTGLAKLPGIREYLNDLLQNDIKLLVYAHHTEVMNGIEEEVKKMKLKYIRIDGSVDINKRHEGVKLFQEDEEVRIGILSLTAAGVGLTLTAASTVVFAEMHWTPAVMLQAEDRIHRMGQTNKICVNYHYLYGDGTLDSFLYDKLQSKLAVVSEILEGKIEYLDVEETKEGIGDFNTTPYAGSAKKKKGNGGERSRTSPSSGKKETSTPIKAEGMRDITSYFQKRESSNSGVTNKSKAIEANNNKNIRSNLTKVESLNWDEIDRLLEEDQTKNNGPHHLEKRVQREIINPFDDDIRDDSREEDEDEGFRVKERRRNGDEGVTDKEGEADDDLKNDLFLSCLEQIFDDEKSVKNDETNSEGEKTLSKRESKTEVKKPSKPGKDDIWGDNALGLWGNSSEQQNKRKKVNQPLEKNLKETSGNSERKKEWGLLKGQDKSDNKEKTPKKTPDRFKISLQPVRKSEAKKVGENEESGDNTGVLREKKRKIDMVELEIDDREAYEPGILHHVTKKLKENK